MSVARMRAFGRRHRAIVPAAIAGSRWGSCPSGPAVGAAAAVLILGSDGVAASAAAGVLMTATGTADATA